jgi:hypothetical protein
LPHLIVPYAATSAHLPGQHGAAPALPPLPGLSRLLSLLEPLGRDEGDEYSLSPPHERALARALGLPNGDGTIPWAAWQAGVAGRACAWFNPCHWQAGMDQVTLQPSEGLELSEADSRALLEALRPWAEEDGLALHFESAGRWRAEGEVFAGLPCASLDRVAHRRVDAWLPDASRHPQARALLRLQSEAQMLFYTHAVNDARAARGLPPVNGFWISGSGVWDGHQQAIPQDAPELDERLRQPALNGDLASWGRAWEQIDQSAVAVLIERAEAGEAVRLTLCGERHAQTWASPARPGSAGLWSRLKGLLRPARQPDIPLILSQL